MRVPIPLEVALAISVVAECWQLPRLAAGLLLAFHCMLRPGELASMRRQDLVLPCDLNGESSSGVVCITQSKTSHRFAKLQSVIVEDVLLLDHVQRVFGHDSPKQFLVGGGVHELVRSFLAIKTALGLTQTPYVLAGYRGGGACEYLRRTSNVSHLQFRGRWTNIKSMWHYLQLGLSATTYRGVPDNARAVISHLASCACDVFAPPNNIDAKCTSLSVSRLVGS
eukprot:1261243-Amphidinium_carterae.1